MQPRDRKPAGTADIAGARRDNRDHDDRDTQGRPHDSDSRRDAFDRPERDQSGARRSASDAFERPTSGSVAVNEGPHSRDGDDHTRDARSQAAMETGRHSGSGREPQPSRSFPDGDTDAHRRELDSDGPLLRDSDTSGYRERWEECQRSFVDEPRDSVKAADELVAEVMQQLASQFASTRSSLERQWDRGDNVSTEDLRMALQRYRDFFNRLLAA
jgi:hypothetical protein